MKNWLLVDLSYVAYKALHSTGGLSFGGVGTGVAFGVLRDLDTQTQLHNIDRVVIAVDSKAMSLRKEVDPKYKSSRREGLTQEDLENLAEFYKQLDRLKNTLLPMSGYKNIIEVSGYEADDVIASIARDLDSDVYGIILSADQDLWQCVKKNVVCYNPTTKVTVTSDWFFTEYGIDPLQWAHVKALAGCGTDDVIGIKGIGEATAAAWFSGKLKPGKKYDLISNNLDVIQRNLPLVKLPFPGIVIPPLVDDEVTEGKKIQVQVELGIREGRAKARPQQSTVNQGFDLG